MVSKNTTFNYFDTFFIESKFDGMTHCYVSSGSRSYLQAKNMEILHRIHFTKSRKTLLRTVKKLKAYYGVKEN